MRTALVLGRILFDWGLASPPFVWAGAKEGGLFEFQTPPPPLQTPPKVFEPVFLQFEILGERVGAKGAEKKICPS